MAEHPPDLHERALAPLVDELRVEVELWDQLYGDVLGALEEAGVSHVGPAVEGGLLPHRSAAERVAVLASERDALRAEVERHSKRLRNIWALAARMWSENHVEEWGDVLTMSDGDWPDDEALATIDRLQARIKELEGRDARLREVVGGGDVSVADALYAEIRAEGARQERERLADALMDDGRIAAVLKVRAMLNAANGPLEPVELGDELIRAALAAVLSEEGASSDGD